MTDPIIIDETQTPFPGVVTVHCFDAVRQMRHEQAMEWLRRIIYAEPHLAGVEITAARRWLMQFGDVEQAVLGS